MYLVDIANSFSNVADECVFVIALVMCFVFYVEDKKCKVQTEREEMIDHFLKD
jgi:hypothetical protein